MAAKAPKNTDNGTDKLSVMREKLHNFKDESGVYNKAYLFSIVIIICAVVHFSFIVIFAHMGIRELTYFNVFSVTLYIALFIHFSYSPSWVTIFAAYMEICIHSTYATVLLGWEFGFPLYMVCIAPLVFFYPKRRSFEPFLYSFLTVLLFILLRVYTNIYGVIYPEFSDSSYITPMFFYNSIISFGMVIAFSAVCTYFNEQARLSLTEKNEQLLTLANIDPLTGLLNRRSMRSRLSELDKKSRAAGRCYCVLLCDVDDFKFVNDRFGHDCGDCVLQGVSAAISASIGQGGIVCRWGGEEFLIVLPDCRNGYEAYKIAEALRTDVQSTDIAFEEAHFNATMTIGVASSAEFATPDELITNADRRMYIGKRNGKNQVIYL